MHWCKLHILNHIDTCDRFPRYKTVDYIASWTCHMNTYLGPTSEWHIFKYFQKYLGYLRIALGQYQETIYIYILFGGVVFRYLLHDWDHLPHRRRSVLFGSGGGVQRPDLGRGEAASKGRETSRRVDNWTRETTFFGVSSMITLLRFPAFCACFWMVWSRPPMVFCPNHW